jgi:heptosyltransferase I
LAPTAGWGAKQWPAERFGALAHDLQGIGFRVFVNAASRSDGAAAEVLHASGGTAQLLPCTVAQLVSLTRRAALVVGGDSGPIHLAAALGRPLVALFGPTDPVRNGPWGSGPMRVLRDPHSVTSHKRVQGLDPGLARITVQHVMDAVQTLGRPDPARASVCENG